MGTVMKAAVISVLLTGAAAAHDSWISRWALRNAAGEWCCGALDCRALADGDVREIRGGYMIGSRMETVPTGESIPVSPDGKYWLCVRPDRSRRCFFTPTPVY